MLMNGSKMIKVRFVQEDKYGFKKGETYNAIRPKSKLGNTEVVCVVDRFGEEYAYPANWFSIIEE